MDIRNRRIVIALLLIIISMPIIYFNNSVLETTYVTYSNEKIPQSFDGVKIVHLSDLHNKSFGSKQNILVKKVKEQNPDYIVITGDIIDRSSSNSKNAMELVNELSNVAPVYYISGNHEDTAKIHYDILKEDLEKNGAIVLSNECVTLTKNNENIFLWGFENSLVGSLDINRSYYSDIDINQFNILLAHKPEYINEYAHIGFDLGFAGHAHGGQWRIPIINQGLVSPGQGILPKYTEGVHQVDNFSLVISRGLGNSIFPLRLFNRPEIVCVTLSSK